MTKYKYIYLAVFVFTFFSVHSQDNGHGLLTTQDILGSSLLSPQAFGFTEKGNQKVSLFTGKSGTTIPVYTYQDNDFNIPIFLEYNMSGFIPNQREGIIGLGWHLNAGGAITRIVN